MLSCHDGNASSLPAARRSQKLGDIFLNNNLKVATQKYSYHASNRTIANENVYAILQGPRADATEAIVLIAAWKNMDGEVNNSGVALVLTLARYFKRWSLWSKDIIFLVTGDSTSGSQAWVDAYHDGHDERYVESLKIKSGALQGAVAIDYPAGPWGHRYDKLHIVYDGVNGQLPNLDLFNTAVQVASGQMGLGCVIQRMWSHTNTYQERLQTMLRGMISQGLGHATGPHSSFIPYHVDAITLVTVGDGWHDEMTLGRTVESLFRSLNNLLEHLHQSFFFYLLIHANRFISIVTYLPSAMLIAVNFSITSIALWVMSGRSTKPIPNPASTNPVKSEPSSTTAEKDTNAAKKDTTPATELVEKDGLRTIVPVAATSITERHLFFPLLAVLTVHFLGLIPLIAFNNWDAGNLVRLYMTFANLTSMAPLFTAWVLKELRPLTPQNNALIQCFSLLLLGMFLAALATLNFSLSFLIGVLTTPLSFVRRTHSMNRTIPQLALLAVLNPVMVVQWSAYLLGGNLEQVLVLAAQGWHVSGLWTQVVIWLVWWPAWMLATTVVAGGLTG
jgi:glycosylphosphatidylinositol transamidase